MYLGFHFHVCAVVVHNLLESTTASPSTSSVQGSLAISGSSQHPYGDAAVRLLTIVPFLWAWFGTFMGGFRDAGAATAVGVAGAGPPPNLAAATDVAACEAHHPH